MKDFFDRKKDSMFLLSERRPPSQLQARRHADAYRAFFFSFFFRALCSTRDLLEATIPHLGDCRLSDTVDKKTTHLVSGGERTLKLMYALSQGCWLVTPEWVLKSLDAEQWLDERPFEMIKEYPGRASPPLGYGVELL